MPTTCRTTTDYDGATDYDTTDYDTTDYDGAATEHGGTAASARRRVARSSTVRPVCKAPRDEGE